MPLIPWFASAFAMMFGSYKKLFLTFLGLSAGPLLIKVLASIGAGWAVYEIGDFALSTIHTELKNTALALPDVMVLSLSLLRVDECIQIIFGAYTARLVLQGWSNGLRKVFVWK